MIGRLSRLIFREAFGHSSSVIRAPAVHARAAMAWLCRAQDATGGGGVARSYSLKWNKAHGKRGWIDAYPETTGYIIPTFFDYASIAGDKNFGERALRMAEWEICVQMDNGAVQGGTIAFSPTPAVFNTGQVLFGWSRAFRETGQERFRISARRAADFLLSVLDSDGGWRRAGSKYARCGINLYDARTAWGLIEVFRITGEPGYREAARRNLDFVVSQQWPNGWFPNCCLDDDLHPLLHTIAYTTEGLLESGLLLNDPKYVDAARRPLDMLLSRQRSDGSLAGRFDSDWRPAARWTCLTGDAQTALCWLRLFEITRSQKYFDAARRMNRFVMETQDLTSPDPGIRGAIKGSHPIWGSYSSYEYPNWAAKFFVDALLLSAKLSRSEEERGCAQNLEAPVVDACKWDFNDA